jgi:beta-glucosidase
LHTKCFRVLLLAVAATLSYSAVQAQEASPAPVRPFENPDLPVDVRVNDLVSRMTLEEKAAQVVNKAAPIPRLHVVGYNWWSEALHGVTVGTATVFPEPIAMASSFDVPLMHDVATAIGTEARAMYHEAIREGADYAVGLDFWTPNLNIFRDPRWGRGQETYGEDPYLTGRLGVAYVTGLQGDDPRYYRVIATPKHFAVHSGPEPLRHRFDALVSKHDIEDTYLPAFRAAIVEGKAGSTMCVYNSINGEPGCANRFLLEDTLRDAWKFKGYVVSDCDAVADIERGHHFVKTLPEAAAISMKRGTDLDCNSFGDATVTPLDSQRYVEAVLKGYLTEAELDVSVKRLMRARFLLGMFDPPASVPYTSLPFSVVDSDEHRLLARKMADESVVLLKNSGVLPLKASVAKIAVVGPLADQVDVLLGNYNGQPSKAPTLLEAIRSEFPNATVTFSEGTTFLAQGSTIPAGYFYTEDGQPGLTAQFFKGIGFDTKPVLTRTDAKVDFEFVKRDPVAEVGPEMFSARWRGYFVPPESGTYSLGALGDDGVRLVVDGRILADSWRVQPATRVLGKIDLLKGHKYPITLEYFQARQNAVVQLLWVKPAELLEKEARAAAKNADVVIAAVGITSELEGEENSTVNLPGFKDGDRTSIDLPAQEEALLKAMKSERAPLVVVLMNGSALAVNWANAHADGIVEGWYDGEEGGTALAETLSGKNNPSGRLPVTFYKGIDELPPFEDYSMARRTYRYFSGETLYPFGYGLSYTTFRYRHLTLTHHELGKGEALGLDVDVTNTGDREGDEVIEVYLKFPPVDGAPRIALRGFSRVHLAPSASERVHFTLDSRDLSLVTRAGQRVVAPGTYTVSVGGGQPGTTAPTLEQRFRVTDETRLPD